MIDFNKLVENFLHRELRPKEVGRYYPSEIGGCLRKSWYSYKFPKETEKDLLKVFYAGELVHEFVADVIRSEKNPEFELEACEASFKLDVDGFVISGRIDDVILVKVNNQRVIVEVKSTGSLAFADEPKEAHVMQLMIYMHALQIYEGVMLYVEKNTLQCKSFGVQYDQKVVDFVLNRFKKLDQVLRAGVIPDPEARIDKNLRWMCRKCNYREECYKETPRDILP